ncbi:protein kinase domain-containing protein [Embleya sp. NPDC001921]
MQPLSAEDPRRVDRFRLVGVLGSGGMGRVFLGRGADGAAVAVKVVRPELLDGGQAEFRRRFVREVDAARNVGAAFTAAVVDADPDAELPWLATEFVPGISLGEAVARFGPLPEASLLELAAGLFTALAGVHAAGLVHRDIKPSNIILGVDGPKVIDFGIARLSGATGLTRTGQTVGTWGFMSPEQFERSDVGPESDIFSAGAVLAHAGTGRPPFPGDSLPVLFANLTTRDPDLAGLPGSLVPLLDAALAKDPAARPAAGAARAMVPAPPTHVGADAGWLPPAVTQAILRATAGLLSASAEPGTTEPGTTEPGTTEPGTTEPGTTEPGTAATPHGHTATARTLPAPVGVATLPDAGGRTPPVDEPPRVDRPSGGWGWAVAEVIGLLWGLALMVFWGLPTHFEDGKPLTFRELTTICVLGVGPMHWGLSELLARGLPKKTAAVSARVTTGVFVVMYLVYTVFTA